MLVATCYILFAPFTNMEGKLKKQWGLYEPGEKAMATISTVFAGFGVYVKDRPETARSVNMNRLRCAVFMMHCLKH